jgi:uncharacterized protein YdaU (DUF1376 family)
MSKDPAFLFYPNDWIGGTMGMTFEEKGAYMELLMLQFNRGHMTTHMIGQVVGQNWVKIMDKFIQDDEGLWFNERLEQEKIKRQNFTKSRRNNISGENQYTKNKKKINGHMNGHMGGHMTSHMENENENNINTLSSNKNSNLLLNSESFKNEKKYFFNDENYFYKISTSLSLSKDEVLFFAEKFIEKLELGEDYKDLKELKKHFANWIKKQDKNSPKVQKTKYKVYTPKEQW